MDRKCDGMPMKENAGHPAAQHGIAPMPRCAEAAPRQPACSPRTASWAAPRVAGSARRRHRTHNPAVTMGLVRPRRGTHVGSPCNGTR
jgi:hypothetical protein